MTSSFTRAIPEEGTVLVFAIDVRLGHPPMKVEVKAEWMTFRNVATPTVAELDTDLSNTGPGTA